MLSNRLAKHFGAAAAAALVVGSANAAIVTWNLNLVIPDNVDGAYINIVTQTTGTAGFTGYDLNPYSSSAGNLSFWCPSGTSHGYIRTQASGAASSLAGGFVVGASGPWITFSNTPAVSGTTVTNGWQLNAINYFGFRFFNEATSAVNYGYGVMQVGANGGERTLLTLAYEDTGGSIEAGAIPAPGAMALLGLAGIAARRRRR
jgi:MYXO-CTERM domain-containing protein